MLRDVCGSVQDSIKSPGKYHVTRAVTLSFRSFLRQFNMSDYMTMALSLSLQGREIHFGCALTTHTLNNVTACQLNVNALTVYSVSK